MRKRERERERGRELTGTITSITWNTQVHAHTRVGCTLEAR
jgi:hypothetical protein